MSMRVSHIALFATVLVLLAPAQSAGQRVPVPVTGREVRATLTTGERVEGELIDVTDARLLLGVSVGLREVRLDALDDLSVRRHAWDTSRVLTWVAVGALVTGGGLAVACSQVEGTSCGGVFPAVALTWGIFGGIFGALLASSAWQDLPVTSGGLRSYSRFPQGAPADFGR